MFKIQLTAVFLLAIPFSLFAQNSLTPVVIASGGGFQASPSGSLSSTFGQLETETSTSTSSSYVITQGFQQPEKMLTGVEEIDNSFEASVFPNPVQDFLTLELTVMQDVTVQLAWINASGQILYMPPAQLISAGTSQVSLDVSSFTSGTYFLRADLGDSKRARIFKIIKN